MKILSVDPGYERLGIAVIGIETDGQPNGPRRGKEHLFFSDCITTDRKLPHHKRLQKIGEAVRDIIVEWQPAELAAEELFFAANKNTALHVAEALGVVLYEAAQHNIPAFLYKPPEIKMTVTGYGRSDKKQVTEMVKKLIRIPQKSGARDALDDEYDAIAVGLTHIACRKTRDIRKT